ncbi:MAG TPA: hypothetical protein VF585_09860 [Chthoniobacterales bacterium]|jgi:protein-S-isoprenylcysteine O-methyltransferase Ste14
MRFLLQTCIGLIRDQTQRRHALSVLVVAALVMLFVGWTFLGPWLIAHVTWFFIYWFACMWLTILIFLLAAYDLLAVRKAGREEQRRLRKQIFADDEDE